MSEPFQGLVAQDAVKKQLALHIKAHSMLSKRPPDIMLSGPSGVGKSTFVRQLAQELNITYEVKDYRTKEMIKKLAFFEVNAQAIKSVEELFKFLQNDYEVDAPYEDNVYTLPPCIIFIDEAHRTHSVLKTQLLSALDDRRRIDFKFNSMVCTLDFANVTFIMATTDLHDLERPLINRFKLVELQPYTKEDIAMMVVAQKPEWPENLAYSIGIEIGKRAKAVMRTAKKDLEDLSIYFQIMETSPSVDTAISYYEEYKEVDEDGLDKVDAEIMKILSYGNCGIKSIASRLRKSEREIEERICWMEHVGCVIKAGGGRSITTRGQQKLGLVPEDREQLEAAESAEKKYQKMIVVDNPEEVDKLIEWRADGTMKKPTEAFRKKSHERTAAEHHAVKAYRLWKRNQKERLRRMHHEMRG